MNTINFYILETTSKQKAWLFACQQLEKIMVENKRVYINVDTDKDADALDLFLWTYRDDSFLPHEIETQSKKMSVPIKIGTNASSSAINYDLLLNLSQQTACDHQTFSSILEIVYADPIVQQAGRVRYKQYRDQGYTIDVQKINEILSFSNETER